MRTRSEIEAQICIEVEEATLGARSAAKIRSTDSLLNDLGLDSLDYATVLLSCERWLGVRVREDGVDWGSIATVGQLAEFLERQQPRNS